MRQKRLAPLSSPSSGTWPGGQHDVFFGAFDDGEELGLFALGHFELVERLLEIVEEGVPFWRCDIQMGVRVVHRAAGIALGASGGCADLLGHQVFEAGASDLVVRLVDLGIGIESRHRP